MSGPWEDFKPKKGSKSEGAEAPPWEDFSGPPDLIAATGQKIEDAPPAPSLSEQGKSLVDILIAVGGGAVDSATLGHSNKILPESLTKTFSEAAGEYPVGAGAGALLGGAIPGGIAAKGVQLLQKGAGMIPLARYATGPFRVGQTGIRGGAIAGGAIGASSATPEGLSDEATGHLENFNTGVGVGLGALMGGVGRVANHLTGVGRAARGLYGQRPNLRSMSPEQLSSSPIGTGTTYFKETAKEIDEALKTLGRTQIRPRKEALNSVLDGKAVSISPDLVDAVPKRPSVMGTGKPKGGLDRMAISMSLRSGDGKANISARRAQRLKEYFQDLARYQDKAVAGTAVPRDTRMSQRADILKRSLEELDPRVSQLNKPMEEMLAIRGDIRNQALSRTRPEPIRTLMADETSLLSSQLKDLDRMTGSSLFDKGQYIKEATGLTFDPQSLLHPLQQRQVIGRTLRNLLGKSLAGRGPIGIANMAPAGTYPGITIGSIIAAERAAKDPVLQMLSEEYGQ